MWECRCDCGVVTWKRKSKLQEGRAKSCGCLRGKPKQDITGRVFGRLTVTGELRKAGSGRNGRNLWHCACECGGEAWVEAKNLTSGNTKSCGCYRVDSGHERRRDISGNVYGRLTVTDNWKRAGGKILWQCNCDCGNVTWVTTTNLRSGNTGSCGCRKRRSDSEWSHWAFDRQPTQDS